MKKMPPEDTAGEEVPSINSVRNIMAMKGKVSGQEASEQGSRLIPSARLAGLTSPQDIELARLKTQREEIEDTGEKLSVKPRKRRMNKPGSEPAEKRGLLKLVTKAKSARLTLRVSEECFAFVESYRKEHNCSQSDAVEQLIMMTETKADD